MEVEHLDVCPWTIRTFEDWIFQFHLLEVTHKFTVFMVFIGPVAEFKGCTKLFLIFELPYCNSL